MSQHYATAMCFDDGLLLIGCRCGAVVEVLDGMKAWHAHLRGER